MAFVADKSVKSKQIQKMVDSIPPAKNYFTDGGSAYLDVDFFGHHRRNLENKNDTHNIESTNADLRHYIAGLARRRRTFFRNSETLAAVLHVFICAYNKFGEAKQKYTDRQPQFSVLNFL